MRLARQIFIIIAIILVCTRPRWNDLRPMPQEIIKAVAKLKKILVQIKDQKFLFGSENIFAKNFHLWPLSWTRNFR